MILLSLFQSKRLEFFLQLLGLLLLLLLLIIAYYTKTYIFVTVVPDDDLVEEPCDEPSGTLIIFIKIIWVKATHILISALRLHQVYVLGLAVNQDSNGGVDLCSSFLDRN